LFFNSFTQDSSMAEEKITQQSAEDNAIQHVESRGPEKPGQVALKSQNDNLGLWATVVKFRRVSGTIIGRPSLLKNTY
jgi:hypothetical protein